MILEASQVWPFLAAVALIELTPGPNMGYLALVSIRSGWRAGLITVAGVTLGLSVYLAATLLGLAEATLRWPWIYDTLRWGGVGYLVWLAWDAWRGAGAGPSEGAVLDGGRLFLRGLLTNLLNAKAAVFFVAILPAFVRPEAGQPLAQATVLGVIYLAVALIVHLAIVGSAGRLKPILDDAGGEAAASWLRPAFALALLGVAAWVALTSGR
jgi:threonine/homoserine/homoserine lactone efflux protein